MIKKRIWEKWVIYLVLSVADAAAANVDKLCQMLKMFGHFGGKNHVDDIFSHYFVRASLEILEYVNIVVSKRELERKSCVMRLEHRKIVVKNGQLVVRVAEKLAVKLNFQKFCLQRVQNRGHDFFSILPTNKSFKCQ